jgi:hypothetical protein
MSALKFSENYYSFRPLAEAFALTRQPATPEQRAQQAALAAIEAKMTQAHELFLARRYEQAFDIYGDASDLIQAQLVPGFPIGTSRLGSATVLDSGVFDTILSAGLEWMNLLPVRQPEIGARSRAEPDPGLLRDAAQFSKLGVHSELLSNEQNAAALADWQLGQAFEVQGNEAQARAFQESARQLSPDVVGLLEQQRGLTRSVGFGEAGGITLPPIFVERDRVLGTMIDGELVQFNWAAGSPPPLADIKGRWYDRRISATALKDLILPTLDPTGVALNLPHYYYYVIPLARGECSAAVGAYERAEQLFFQAAGYRYLNAAIEAPYVWQCLAGLYLDWGNVLFRQDETAQARDVYERLLALDGTVPASALYTMPALMPGADIGRAVIGALPQFIAHAADPTAPVPDLNPVIVGDILEVHQQLLKIAAGLDFWGHWHQSVPIWTFDYLQEVAINFAQMAVGAERDYISFQSRADESALTRQQLAQGVNQGKAEIAAALLAAQATADEVEVYEAGAALAQKRSDDAVANAAAYAGMSADQIVRQALAAQLGGGDDGDPGDLNGKADILMGIGPVADYLREHPGNWRLEGSAATLSAAEQLVAARLNRQYELDVMNRQSEEMALAQAQASAELKVAHARAAAATAGVAVAQVRTEAARQNLAAFDAQVFTPEVWDRMGMVMLRLYRRYFDMALRAARLMQRAYNFETDQSLALIKSDYAADEVHGLLGADALMADIQTFTYNLITATRSKPQPLRQTISLAQRYGFLFENQLRRTGAMEFDTSIDDFDSVYPGTYAGRIDAIEVEVLGIVPPTGISGTLTNNGVSAYRTPAELSGSPGASGLKYRIQSRETLVLSDYYARQDALLSPHDSRMSGIFQGAGLASSWRLELPKAINDLDYGALTDVRLTFYYKARFDPQLRDKVLAQLAARPGIHAGQRGIPLRWLYPDAFFRFQDSGELRITLRPGDFRRNEKNPELEAVGLLLVTDGSVAAAGVDVALATPSHPVPATATTGPDGAVPAGSVAWAELASGKALGEYVITVPGLAEPAQRAAISNIALILGYSYTPVS